MSVSRRAVLGSVLLLGALPTLGAALLARAAGASAPWWADLLTPFVLHAGVSAALSAVVWGSARRWLATGLALAACAVSGALSGALWTTAVPPLVPALTVLHVNASVGNPELDAVVALVRESGADVAVIVELSPALERRLAALPPPWRPLLTRPSRDAFGVGVYAQRAATSTRAVMLGEMFPTIEIGWGPDLVLRAVHPMPPFDAESTATNRAHLAELARWITAERRPTVVIGDLNATTWSASWAPLEAAGVRSAMLGHGHPGTWPSVLGWAGVTIDHLLLPDGWAAETLHTVEVPGSDHRGLRAVLGRTR